MTVAHRSNVPDWRTRMPTDTREPQHSAVTEAARITAETSRRTAEGARAAVEATRGFLDDSSEVSRKLFDACVGCQWFLPLHVNQSCRFWSSRNQRVGCPSGHWGRGFRGKGAERPLPPCCFAAVRNGLRGRRSWLMRSRRTARKYGMAWRWPGSPRSTLPTEMRSAVTSRA